MVSDSSITGADIQDGSILRADVGESLISLSTLQSTTSGTFKDFTGIPSWARRVTTLGFVVSGGLAPLSGVLGMVRLTPTSGTPAFDDGSVDIAWQ